MMSSAAAPLCKLLKGPQASYFLLSILKLHLASARLEKTLMGVEKIIHVRDFAMNP
jgi:hypothetical protein